MCNMKALSLMVRTLWPGLKFFKSRSNFKVKVTGKKLSYMSSWRKSPSLHLGKEGDFA